jgi:flagellar biosynthesis/type III secretory pathway protein FliH
MEKWRNIQFHKNLWKVDERMLRLQWEMDAREEGLAKGLEQGLEQGRKQGWKGGREEERKYILELMEQGLSADEIKRRLTL